MSGISAAGFATKTRAQILADLQAEARVQFGADVDLSTQSGIGQFLGITADKLWQMWQTIEDVYYSAYIDTAEGASLERVCALGGISRRPAIKAAIDLTLEGTAGTVVAVGFQAQTASGIAFTGTEGGTIAASAGRAEISSTPVPFSGSTVPAIANDTYDLDVTIDGGALRQLSLAISTTDDWDTIVAGFQAALRVLTGSTETVTVIGGRIRVISATTGASSAVLIADGTAGNEPLLAYIDSDLANMTHSLETPVAGSDGSLEISAQADVEGPEGNVTVGTVTNIVTPISGVDSVTNLSEGTGGDDIETDADLRERYKERGVSGGSSVLAIQTALNALDSVVNAKVYENNTDAVVGSLPAHSIWAVVDGGTADEILEILLNYKPAGIETCGSTSGTVVDNQGISRTFNWSEPTYVDIYVQVDIVKNADWDSSYEATVKARVAEIIGGTSGGVSYEGNGIGADVYSWQLIANFDDIQGIDSLTVTVDTVSPPVSATVSIDADERARTDDTKITVNAP